tara:strand:- start:211 stop:414 length:204 start_codon:yes stop_codon:yes gene_type:complete
MRYNSIEEQEARISHDEEISAFIRLVRDIYYHTLGQSGDRSKYPCPEIDKILIEYGIDLKANDEKEE